MSRWPGPRVDIAEKDDWDAQLEAQLVRGEAGRIERIEELHGVIVSVLVLGHLVCRKVHLLPSREGEDCVVVDGVDVLVLGGEDGAFYDVVVLPVGLVVEGTVHMLEELVGVVVEVSRREHAVRHHKIPAASVAGVASRGVSRPEVGGGGRGRCPSPMASRRYANHSRRPASWPSCRAAWIRMFSVSVRTRT